MMALAPLFTAPAVIQIHAFAAMAAFALGLVQFAAPKGTIPHRTIGWIWVALMTAVAVSAFFIHEIRLWGPWSPIHLLAIFTLAMLPFAVLHARKPCAKSSWGDDQHLHRRAGNHGSVHIPARPYHARGRVQAVILSRRKPRARRRSRIAPQAPRG